MEDTIDSPFGGHKDMLGENMLEKRISNNSLGTDQFGDLLEDDHGVYDIEDTETNELSAVFENPLADVPRDKVLLDVDTFCRQYGLEEHLENFKKGALISQNPGVALALPELSEEDKETLRREQTHKWSQPWQLYFMASKYYLLPSIVLQLT